MNINIDFDPKTKRFVVGVPFILADLARAFPSRRFDPKTKKWKMPLVAANVRHIKDRHMDADMTETARAAMQNFEAMTQAPKYQPFPRHIYKFPLAPFEHQGRMMDLSWGLAASAWFAEMGTGKTYAAISIACARWMAGEIDGVAIICPSTLRRTWLKELKKYATCEYDYRIHETKASWLKEFYASTPRPGRDALPILGISVEGLGVSEQLYDSACGFYVNRRVLTICDESSRIKNAQRLRTQRAIMLGGASVYRMILNGTPIALGIQDLWAQYEFLDPNILGTGDYWAFRTRYIQMGGYDDKQIIGYSHVDELMNLIRPYTIEVRKKDVLKDLPPKVPKTIEIEATPEQRKLFKYIATGKDKTGTMPLIKVDNVLERDLRLRQVVGGWLPKSVMNQKPTIIDGEEVYEWHTVLEPLKDNPKMNALFDWLDTYRQGYKFIIWSTFVHEIEFIANALKLQYGEHTVETYYGKTPMEDRARIEDRYCQDASMRYFIGNPTAAGLGLTLVSGENDVMVYYSGTSAFIDRAQSEDRAHRIGQKNSVIVADFVMDKSIDLVIQASIEAKMDLDKFVKDQLAKGVDIIKIISGD